jgi:hypothetical protein
MVSFKEREEVILMGKKKIILGGMVLLTGLMLAGCAGTYSGYGYYNYPYHDYDYGYYGSPYDDGHHREFGEHHREFGHRPEWSEHHEGGEHHESGEHGRR